MLKGERGFEGNGVGHEMTRAATDDVASADGRLDKRHREAAVVSRRQEDHSVSYE